MSRELRAALLGALALGALGLAFAREPFVVSAADPGWWGLPSHERWLRAVRAFAGLAVLNLAAWGFGHTLMRRLPAADLPDARPAVRVALGFAALSIAVLGLAAVHALRPWAIATLLGVGCALALASLWRSGTTWATASGHARKRRLGVAALLAAALSAPVLAAFGPDPGWDALTYHLAVPERYAFANGIVVTPFSVLSTFPHATAMLYLLAQSLEGDALARLLHLEFGVLTAWLAWRVGRAHSRRAGWLAAAALAACPLFAWELTVAYADLSATLYTLLAVCVLHAPGAHSDVRRCVAAGIFAGAAAACRYPSWPLLPVLAACLWLPGTPLALGVRARARATLAFAGAAAALLSPWLLRNVVFAGNPTAPLLQSVFAAPGAEFFAPLALEQNAAFLRSIGMGRGALDLLALPWNLTFEAQSGDYRAFGYRVGVLYAVGLAASLLVGDRGSASGRARNDALGRAALLWPAGLLALVWFATVQEPRYLLPSLVLMAVAGAAAADRLLPAGRAGRAWLALPLAAVVHTQLPIVSALPHHYGVAAGTLRPPAPPAARVARQLRDELGESDRLVIFFEPRGHYFAGLDYVPYHLGDGSPLLAMLHDAVRADAVPELFRALGATHVLLETRPRAIATPQVTPSYARRDFVADVRALERFVTSRGTRVAEAGSLAAFRLEFQR